MKSSPLFILTVAFLATPFFMGQSAPGSISGGGGCGCSDADKTETAVNVSDTITGDVEDGGGILPASDAEGTDGATDACEIADASGAARAKDWTQDIESFVGLPVNEACESECGGDGNDAPWSLSIHLKGSLLSAPRSYSLHLLKEEYEGRIRYLEAKRDAADPDGCPVEEQDPCWRTCGGDECLAGDVAIKDGDVLEKEAKAIALDYLNSVCKLGLKAEDLDADDAGDRIKTAFEKVSLTDTLQCAEGVALTATQIAPVAERLLKAGLVRDEKGEPYTADQMFKCLKKSILKD